MLIDAEFAALCPPLTREEYAELEASLLTDGCRDALVVWREEGLLLDGHNRKRICDEHGLAYRTTEVSLPDRDSAVAWMLRNQLGRRNLHPDAASLMRGRLYNMQKREWGGDRRSENRVAEVATRKTSELLADELGVSERTIRNDAAFAEAVDALRPVLPDIDSRVMTGDIPSRQAVIEAAKEPETAPDTLAKPHVSYNSGDNEWYTPAEYIRAARAVMGCIDLDPASSDIANEVVGATAFYTKETDGLSHDWHGRIWLNPPYSQPAIQKFCDKLGEQRDNILEAIVLVNNATETRWFQGLARLATAICFPQGRVRFWAPDKTTTAPLQGQALLYMGSNVNRFLDEFREFGFTVMPGAHR